MALVLDERASRQMIELQRELAVVLTRANERKVEAAIAAFALLRLARELLDKYPEAARVALVDEAVVPYLRHEPETADEQRLIYQ